jgi:diguanylate cyclase (GGDEF)-like protein
MSAKDVLNNWFNRQSQARISGISVALIILVGWLDYYVDPETSFSIFYIIPVALGAWYGNGPAGIAVSILAAAVWTYTYFASGGPNANSPVLFWNAAVRLAFFLIIASLLSGLKETARKLTEQAHVDSLTDTYNSRAFYSRLNEEINRARRYRRPFSVAYIDLDNFKTVNDLHGHTEGDRLLRNITALMKRNARSTDCIARMGGDEFTILFPETDTKSSRDAVQKIREELLKEIRNEGWLVTLSIGMVTYEEAPLDAQMVVKAADDLMYSVKKKGKNGLEHRVWDGTRFDPAE